MLKNSPSTALRRSLQSFCVLALLLTLTHCARKPAETVVSESYSAVEGSVGFEIISLGGSDGSERWLAIFTGDDKTTKFGIELGPATAADDKGVMLSSGHGQFFSETGSDAMPLLEGLKSGLRAKRMPTNVQKLETLPFDFFILSEGQSRSDRGAFSNSPKGNWTTMKFFFANDQAQLLFNFNPVIHKAEFSVRDSAYADRVLAELAKIL